MPSLLAEPPADHDNIFKSPLLAFVEQNIVGGVFEEVLSEMEVFLPDDARQGDEEEACLYGAVYDHVCSSVEIELRHWLKKVLPDVDLTKLLHAPDELDPKASEALIAKLGVA